MGQILADRKSVAICAVSAQSVVNQLEIKHVKHCEEALSRRH